MRDTVQYSPLLGPTGLDVYDHIGASLADARRRFALSKIADVEVIPVVDPKQNADDLDGTVDTVIVRIFDEEGRYGIGEADAPPMTVKNFIEMPSIHLWS